MKSLDSLIVIFVFGLGISFVVARGIWEAREFRLAQLKAARGKKKDQRSLIKKASV